MLQTKRKEAFASRWRNDLNSSISKIKFDGKLKASHVKITETPSGFHYELKIPGYVKEDFIFYISGNDLVVTTDKSKKIGTSEKDEHKSTRHSYCYASAYFKTRFPLPYKAIRNEIIVDYTDEVLSFDLFKLDGGKSKNLQVD